MPRAVDGWKVCACCKENKRVEEYTNNCGSGDGLLYRCRACSRLQRAARTASGEKAADNRRRRDRLPGYDHWAQSKHRAKKRGKPHTISYEWVQERFVGGACKYCEDIFLILPSEKGGRSGGRPGSPSLDCVDPRGGYTPDNTVAACYYCNVSKSNLTYAVWRERILRLAKLLEGRPEAPNE